MIDKQGPNKLQMKQKFPTIACDLKKGKELLKDKRNTLKRLEYEGQIGIKIFYMV